MKMLYDFDETNYNNVLTDFLHTNNAKHVTVLYKKNTLVAFQ